MLGTVLTFSPVTAFLVGADQAKCLLTCRASAQEGARDLKVLRPSSVDTTDLTRCVFTGLREGVRRVVAARIVQKWYRSGVSLRVLREELECAAQTAASHALRWRYRFRTQTNYPPWRAGFCVLANDALAGIPDNPFTPQRLRAIPECPYCCVRSVDCVFHWVQMNTPFLNLACYYCFVHKGLARRNLVFVGDLTRFRSKKREDLNDIRKTYTRALRFFRGRSRYSIQDTTV